MALYCEDAGREIWSMRSVQLRFAKGDSTWDAEPTVCEPWLNERPNQASPMAAKEGEKHYESLPFASASVRGWIAADEALSHEPLLDLDIYFALSGGIIHVQQGGFRKPSH